MTTPQVRKPTLRRLTTRPTHDSIARSSNTKATKTTFTNGDQVVPQAPHGFKRPVIIHNGLDDCNKNSHHEAPIYRYLSSRTVESLIVLE